MNVEYIIGFIEAVNQKSISKASEKLNITSPALSKQIRRIEEYFNIPLVLRTTSGIELTKAGELVYNKLKTVLWELSSLQTSLKKFQEAESYTIGTLQSLAGTYLPPKIMHLKKNGKQINVITRNNSNELLQLIKNREVDGVILEQQPVHKSLLSLDLFKEPFLVILPIHHPLSIKKSLTLKDICYENFVSHPTGCSIRQRISNIMESYGHKLQVGTEVEFNDYLIGYVAAGAGIAVVPEITFLHADKSMVKGIPLNEPTANRTISLITNSDTTEKFLYKYFK